jgi:hypothetical protein
MGSGNKMSCRFSFDGFSDGFISAKVDILSSYRVENFMIVSCGEIRPPKVPQKKVNLRRGISQKITGTLEGRFNATSGIDLDGVCTDRFNGGIHQEVHSAHDGRPLVV